MIKMQHDKDNNCHYCGYGPHHRSPNWSNEHPGVCCVTHSDDPPENAKNENEWRKFKRLPRNFSSGGTVIIKVPQKRQPRIRSHKRRPKSARKITYPKKANCAARRPKSDRKISQPKKANHSPPPPPLPSISPIKKQPEKSYYTPNDMRWNGMKNGEV
jgi:hypothetical protein